MSFWNDVPVEQRVTLFGFSHIIFIISVIVVSLLFIWKLGKVKDNLSIVRKVMIFISSIQVITLYTWSGLELGFSLEAGLPIHFCRIGSFLGLYFLITEDIRVFKGLYYLSAFAVIAIMLPVRVHPIYTHVIGWSYQISHIMIILVWIMGVCIYKYRPTIKLLNKAIIVFLLVTLVVWRFNYMVGDGEYLYLRGDVNRPFLKDLNDLVWIFGVMVVSYVVMFFMTLPFVKGDKDVVSG